MKKILLRHLPLFAALLLAFAPISAVAAGMAPSIYTVSGVKVNVEDSSAAAAKAAAMKQAHAEALQILMRRLVASDELESVSKINPAISGKWVEAIEIKNERSSATRYTAEVTVIFRQSAVESWLQQQSISYTAASSNAFLIIPIYDRGDQPVLLSDDNLWYGAWKKIALMKSFGLVPVSVPMQNGAVQLADIEPMVNVEKLQQIAAQNNAVQVLVARAAIDVKNTPAGTVTTVHVRAQNYGSAISTSMAEVQVESAPNMGLDAAFEMAAQKFLAQMEEEWKSKILSNQGPIKTVDVMVPIRSLNDWVMLESRLQSMAELRKMNLRAITRDVVQLSLDIGDDGENLPELFAKYGFELTAGNQIWMLRAL